MSMQPGTPTQSSPALNNRLDNQSQTGDESDQLTEAKSLLCESDKTNMKETPDESEADTEPTAVTVS